MNPHVAQVPESLIRAIHARKRPGDIDLGLGEPTLRPDAAPFEAALRWVGEHGCPYTPNAGVDELRERIAGQYGRGAFTGAANVCVTVGSEEALYLAIKAVVDPARHEVLVVEPCYLAYPKICALEGIRHRMVPLSAEDGFAPRASAVLDAIGPDTRLIVINSPSNPTGRIWPEAELRALAEGIERTGSAIYVLSDDVYRELYYTERPPRSIADWHPLSLIAGSVSKSNALTGLRLGWLIGPPDAIAPAIRVHQFVNTAASTFSQRVALELFRDPVSLSAHLPAYREARGVLLESAGRHRVPLLAPEGAFYALARLTGPGSRDSVAAAGALLEERRVVTVPGRAFGESCEGWLRLSWVAPARDIEEGMRRIGEHFATVR